MTPQDILDKLDKVATLTCPITVRVDNHGQFDDLLEIFDVGGEVPETNFIFIVDFVDRGYNSVETFIYLLTLKIKYPERITLLNGNHESRQITQAFGFMKNVKENMEVLMFGECVQIFLIYSN